MSLHSGLREVDITRRENSVVSWLGFREHMVGKELDGLFNEWTTGPYASLVGMLTQIALDSLIRQEIVRQTEVRSPGGMVFTAFDLVDPSFASRADPEAVELVPREAVLLGMMDIRRGRAHTAAELNVRPGLRESADTWRTEACLGHLAHLGLLRTAEGMPGAYILQ